MGAHNSNPIDFVKRLLRARPKNEATFHDSLYTERIRKQVGEDPRHQAIAASAITTHAQVTALTLKLSTLSPGGKPYDAISSSLMRWQDHEAKLLRMLGFARVVRKAKEGKQFTPPRPGTEPKLVWNRMTNRLG